MEVEAINPETHVIAGELWGAPFSMPLISRVSGNLWLGGCIDGVQLPDDFAFVVSLYPQARYALGPETVRIEAYIEDAQEVPDVKGLYDLARITSAFFAKGKTLVHCHVGLNRSALLVGIALHLGGTAPADALVLLQKRSSAVLCNSVFQDWFLELGD